MAVACNLSNKHYRLSCRRAGSSPPSDPRDIVASTKPAGGIKRETDCRHRPELGRHDCAGFHRAHFPRPRRAEICRWAERCDGVLRQDRNPGAWRHGPIRRDPGACWWCPAYRWPRYALDKSPLRHRDARHDPVGPDAYTWMERERSGSDPAGVEPTPRAWRQWEGGPRRDLARERRIVRADRQVSVTVVALTGRRPLFDTPG